MKLSGQFLRFSLIGALGFLVDISVLYLALGAGLNLYGARLVSFAVAVTFTWLGNRLFTFSQPGQRSGSLSSEWLRYVLAMGGGGLLNYLVYALLVSFVILFRQHPWAAVAAGTAVGMVFNFLLARKILGPKPA